MSTIQELAEPAGEQNGRRMWKLDGQLLDDEQLLAKMQKRYDRDSRERELERELSAVMPARKERRFRIK